MQILILDTAADQYAAQLALVAPDAAFLTARSEADALEKAAQAEVLIALAPGVTPALLQAMPGLRWIQALTTGVDTLAGLEGVAITNCAGVHGPQMSELAILLMMASARRFPAMVQNQQAATWDRWPQPLLAGKTACLVGLGSIAEHLAAALGALGMTVTGVSSRTDAPGVTRIYPRAQLAQALAGADFTVVLTPYAADTHHIIDAAALATMPATAHLINLARGGCVDEAAVAQALRDGTIAGAALDVFAQEPLPAESPLWSVPNLIITPHVGGFSDIYHQQVLPIVTANLADYVAGGVEGLKHKVTP